MSKTVADVGLTANEKSDRPGCQYGTRGKCDFSVGKCKDADGNAQILRGRKMTGYGPRMGDEVEFEPISHVSSVRVDSPGITDCDWTV